MRERVRHPENLDQRADMRRVGTIVRGTNPGALRNHGVERLRGWEWYGVSADHPDVEQGPCCRIVNGWPIHDLIDLARMNGLMLGVDSRS